MPINALIFDFDGLILDTETPEYEAWRQVYAEHGCDLPMALWADTIGRGHEQIKFDPYEYLYECSETDIDREEIRAQRRALYYEGIAREPILPGVVAYLEEARERKLKLAVASSSAHDWVDGHLRRLGLFDYFALTCCSDDVSRTKPEPDLYLAAAERLGVSVGEVIAFEDSPNGSLAAKRAGMYCVVITNPITEALPFTKVDRRIASMADVPLANILSVAERELGNVGATD